MRLDVTGLNLLCSRRSKHENMTLHGFPSLSRHLRGKPLKYIHTHIHTHAHTHQLPVVRHALKSNYYVMHTKGATRAG